MNEPKDAEIVTTETMKLEPRALSALDQAKAFEIKSNEDFTAVDHHAANLALLEREIKKQFEEPKRKAFEAHRAISAMESRFLAPIAEARKIEKAKMKVWADAQEAAREAERKRLEDEAFKKAEGEAAIELMKAEESGDAAKIEEVLAAPIVIATPIVQKMTPKTRTVIRSVWKVRVDDPALVPREFLIPDEAKLRKYAIALGKDAKVAGVTFYQEAA